MRIHSQNLNDDRRGNPIGSMFWHGRAWLRSSVEYREYGHVEWLFGKHASNFGVTVAFGTGDSDSGLQFHVCLPWLFSFYITLYRFIRCKERKTGIAIHNGAFWIYPFIYENESRFDWSWWKKCHAFHFPWTFNHYKTEILAEDGRTVWCDRSPDGPRLGFLESWEDRKKAEASVSSKHGYRYTLKNGQVQHRTATIHINRMTWRARWYPVIWRQKVSTSIDVNFDAEVGEGTGSWKGGWVGTGYEMLPEERSIDTLRRMERERKFNR